ncbi:MAG: virulence-related protein [Deltaproteobacteria bacterium]
MDKKEIIKLLEQHFGVKAKYMGIPSFAHQIPAGEKFYTVTREGNVEDAEGRPVTLESIINSPANEEAVSAADAEQGFDAVEITLPLAGHTGISLRNMVNMIYSKQTLIQKALSLQEKLIEEDLVRELSDAKLETQEDFLTLLIQMGSENYPGMSFDLQHGLITFKFGPVSTEQIKACTDLIALINENAKILKHASSRQGETDNDKYTFRTWLLRLGMIGDEYKATRKTLLANLEGNGAFRKPGVPEDGQRGQYNG